MLSLSFSGFDPACVKTRASKECAELFSPFSSFDCDCQCCSFPIQRNRDEISTRKFGVGVFTQAGSKTDVTSLKCDVRCSPESRRGPVPHGQANCVNSTPLFHAAFSDYASIFS